MDTNPVAEAIATRLTTIHMEYREGDLSPDEYRAEHRVLVRQARRYGILVEVEAALRAVQSSASV